MKKDWNEKIEILVIYCLLIALALLVLCYLLKLFNVNVVILASITVGIFTISVLLLLFEIIAIFVIWCIEVWRK